MAGLSTLTSQTRGQHETTEIDFLAKKKTNSEDTFPQYKESQNLLAGSQCAGHQDLEGQEDHIGEEKSEQGQLLVVRLGVKQFSLEADFWQYFPQKANCALEKCEMDFTFPLSSVARRRPRRNHSVPLDIRGNPSHSSRRHPFILEDHDDPWAGGA